MDTFNSPGGRLPTRGDPVTVNFGRDDVLVIEESEAA